MELLKSRSQPAGPFKKSEPSPLIFSDEEFPEITEPVFVGREFELTKLDNFFAAANKGNGHVAFVTGEAGSGKTALVQTYAKKIQIDITDLVVSTGRCNAYTGVGDPYLPFREILSSLTGNVQHKMEAQDITREQAMRLWHLAPLSVQALLDVGPDLIDTFLSGKALLSRGKNAFFRQARVGESFATTY